MTGVQTCALPIFQVGALTDWSKISGCTNSAAAIKTGGTLWSWGNNVFGQLGLGNVTFRSSPVQVGALTDWSEIAGGVGITGFLSRWFIALKTNGTLWTWGSNGGGQLGQGDTTPRSSPVQVGSATDWAQVVGGYLFAHAIKTNGTLWAWGSNAGGQLGLGDITHRSSPAQVGSGTNWTRLAPGCEVERAAIRT